MSSSGNVPSRTEDQVPGTEVASNQPPSTPSFQLPLIHPLQPSIPYPGSTTNIDRHSTPLSTDRLKVAQERWRQLFSTPAPLIPQPLIRPIALTTHNLRSNEPWGDVIGPKTTDLNRIYVSNLNGMQLVRTLSFICCRVCSKVDIAAELAPRRRRAMPPIEGTMRSNAALQSLLNIIAECLRRERPSYDRHFNRVASVEDLFGREPH